MKQLAIVTGASSGIGLATVNSLLEANYTIVAGDIQPPPTALQEQWQQQGVEFYPLDVANEGGVKQFMQSVVEQFGSIDVLVNCAGISGWGGAADVDMQQWQQILNINLTGSLLTSKYALPYMLERNSGVIVNVASIFGLEACDNNVAYNVSKGGVIQLTRSLAADYASRGIRSNCVAPGLIETPMTAVVKEIPKMHEEFVSWHLQGRAGKPEEVAAVIEFLCSPKASFVNGQVIPVDGGFSAGRKFSI